MDHKNKKQTCHCQSVNLDKYSNYFAKLYNHNIELLQLPRDSLNGGSPGQILSDDSPPLIDCHEGQQKLVISSRGSTQDDTES